MFKTLDNNFTLNGKTKAQTEMMFNDTKVSNPDDIAHIFTS